VSQGERERETERLTVQFKQATDRQTGFASNKVKGTKHLRACRKEHMTDTTNQEGTFDRQQIRKEHTSDITNQEGTYDRHNKSGRNI
jgi:hypothetical protein